MPILRIADFRYLAAVILLLLICFYQPATAQNRVTFSSTEDIAIAFYKTGGSIPNFERWTKERKPYNLTPWARREAMLKNEMTRLKLAYRNFDPKGDFLTIRTFVDMDPQEQVGEDEEVTYKLPITFSEAPDALYFPYEFLGERIVLMPYSMEKVMNGEITEAQYEFITDALRHSAKNTMIVRLRANEADLSRPYKIDGLYQWVFKTDIVSLEIWSKQGRLLWEYTAPWYTSPNTVKLNNIYNDRPTESPERGAVKPLF